MEYNLLPPQAYNKQKQGYFRNDCTEFIETLDLLSIHFIYILFTLK